MKIIQVSRDLLNSALLLGILVSMVPYQVAFSAQSKWQFNDLQINYDNQNTQVTAASVTLLPETTISQLKYVCQSIINVYPQHDCPKAQLTFNLEQYKIALQGQVAYDLSLPWVKIDAIDQKDSINLHYDSRQQLQLLELKQLALQQWLPTLMKPIKENLNASLSGTVNYDIGTGLLAVSEPLKFSNFNYEHSDDLIALGLSGVLNFNYDVNNGVLNAKINIDNGEALLKQVYINFAEFPLQLNFEVKMDSSPYQVKVAINHEKALDATAEFTVQNDMSLQDWHLDVAVLDSDMVNKQLINSVLEIYGFTNNKAAGQFTVSAEGQGLTINQMGFNFTDFSFSNTKRKLAVDKLNGQVDWQWQQISKPSKLSWQNLKLSGLPVDAAQIEFNLSEDRFKLYGRHDFPVFDGAFVIERLDIDKIIGEQPSEVHMDAEIEPISMNLITNHLGWPEMAGQFSGEVPGLIKTGNVINFEGTLNLSVFDGTVRIKNLSMERLFGVAPVIAADIDLNFLDLATVTKTFDFGLITGRLSGEVGQLRVTNWKVDRMDAKIYSVESENSDQTISQKAIENISSLGGIQGAISRSFLRFFERFKYKKLKLSCKLHNSVCLMGGIDNKLNQFTIVEGGGLPKINIVGFAREIDWDVFVNRLLNASYD